MLIQMAADVTFLAVLLTLQCIHSAGATSVSGARRCSSFQHLENGQTFFRYGGLLVVFHCHPGYKLHGYKTNSCVSGHWSRDLPVCVGSSCSDPGSLVHGTSSVNEDGSWAEFSCNRGFWLDGPAKLFCKGHSWNSTKPVCKEYDMMSSTSGSSAHKPNTHKYLQAATVLTAQQQPNRDIVSDSALKEATFKPGAHSQSLLQMSKSQRIKETKPEVRLQQHIHLPSFKIREEVQTTQTTNHKAEENEPEGPETGSGGPEEKGAENVSQVTQTFASKSDLYTTVSSTTSTLVSTTQTISPAERNTLRTEMFTPTSPLTSAPQPSALPELSSERELQSGAPITSQEGRTLSGGETGFHFHPPPSGEREKEESTHQSTTISSISSTSSGPSFSLSSPPRFNGTEQELDLWMKTTAETPPLALSLNKLPCPYPPSPTHGTFFFQNVENPGPRQYKHYIQYSCYPGYTLAHGDKHNYCQQGGTWNGTTPVCLDIDECSSNEGLGPCMEQCHNSPGSYRCSCTQGHVLAGDGHGCSTECPPGYRQLQTNTPDDSTIQALREECEDINECLEEKCEWHCVNLPGSHRCGCPKGYTLRRDRRHCKDINECRQRNGGCSHLCINHRGGHRCACPASHRLSSSSWRKCLPRTTAHTAG